MTAHQQPKAAFTPWQVANHNEIVAIDTHETLIAEVFTGMEDDWRANARLIASAPMLLAVLKALRLCTTEYREGCVWLQAGTENLDKLTAAINQAEGRT